MGTAVLGIVLVVVGILFGGVGVGHAHDGLQPPRVYMESWTDEDGMYLWLWPVEGADEYRIEYVQTGYGTSLDSNTIEAKLISITMRRGGSNRGSKLCAVFEQKKVLEKCRPGQIGCGSSQGNGRYRLSLGGRDQGRV